MAYFPSSSNARRAAGLPDVFIEQTLRCLLHLEPREVLALAATAPLKASKRAASPDPCVPDSATKPLPV